MKREDAPGRRDFPLFRPITNRWMDQDNYGHVNNVEYYSYFDTAVNQHLIESAGLNPRSTDVVGMVVDTQCSFFHELTFPETVEVGIRVPKLGRSSIAYEIGIFRQGEEKPAELGHFVHVYVERATMTPTPIPAHVRAAVEPLVVQ